MMAAMVLGKDVLPPMGTWVSMDLKIVMIIHFLVSIGYGLIDAWLVHRFNLAGTVMIVAALGVVIYIVNFYLVAPVAFGWFAIRRNWIDAFSHLMFGAILGVAYIAMRGPKLPHRLARQAMDRMRDRNNTPPFLPRTLAREKRQQLWFSAGPGATADSAGPASHAVPSRPATAVGHWAIPVSPTTATSTFELVTSNHWALQP